jgi:hypothetical protein
MTLKMFTYDDQLIGLTGAYQGGENDLVFLGLNGLCKQVGPHFIGFDDRIKPTMVRIFFDPAQSDLAKRSAYSSIGYVQLGEITFNGVPIMPWAYGQEYVRLGSYMYLFNNNLKWIDTVDIERARRHQVRQPFFAYNGYYRNETYQNQDFFYHPMPSGSLTGSLTGSLPVMGDGRRPSLCASLYDPINLDIDGPPANDIIDLMRSYLERGIDPLKSVRVSTNDVVQRGLLNLAKESLNSPEYQIDDDISSIQVIGPLLLIQLLGPEGEEVLFCAFYDLGGHTSDSELMKIYYISLKELREIYLTSMADMFQRIKEDLQKRNIMPLQGGPIEPAINPQKRGRGAGLNGSPFHFKDGKNPVIGFDYLTLAFGEIGEGLQCFGGVKWRVSREFDLQNLCYKSIEIYEPEEVTPTNVASIVGGRGINKRSRSDELLYIDPIKDLLQVFYSKISSQTRQDFDSDDLWCGSTGDKLLQPGFKPGFGDHPTQWAKED